VSNWVGANFNNSGGNRAGKARFSGTWVAGEVAISIANDCSLEKITLPPTDPKPDLKTKHRKSSRHNNSSSRHQTRNRLHRSNCPLHPRPLACPHLTLQSAAVRLLRLLPTHPPFPPVHLQSHPTGSPVATHRSQHAMSPAPSPIPKVVSNERGVSIACLARVQRIEVSVALASVMW
jgi:hypothetical protein